MAPPGPSPLSRRATWIGLAALLLFQVIALMGVALGLLVRVFVIPERWAEWSAGMATAAVPGAYALALGIAVYRDPLRGVHWRDDAANPVATRRWALAGIVLGTLAVLLSAGAVFETEREDETTTLFSNSADVLAGVSQSGGATDSGAP